MLLIYNLSGLLVGLGGLLLGILVFGLTRHLSAALMMIGLFWLIFGRGSKQTPEWVEAPVSAGAPPPSGPAALEIPPRAFRRGPAPSIFFIPLWIWAIPFILLTIPAFIFDRVSAAANKDPRMARFREDESDLRKFSTTGVLAPALRMYLIDNAEGAELELADSHVLVNTSPDAVLVLIRIQELRELNNSVRQKGLDTTLAFLNEQPASKGKRIFIGLKGGFIYGAIRTPSSLKIDKTVRSDALLEYYSSEMVPKRGASRPGVSTRPADTTVPSDPAK